MTGLKALERALLGDLKGWTGLAPQLSLQNLGEALRPVDRVRPPDNRIRTYRRFTVFVYERPVSPSPVEAWFVIGNRDAGLVEWDDPIVWDLEGTLERYGPPELVLADHRVAVGATVEELVYASRGIAMSVATPFASGNERGRSIVHIQLFSSISIESYITDIGAGPDSHPHPI